MTTKVSVVMSVYKDRGRLKETIQSVTDQTYSDFEFVIIDDASPDGTLEKLRQFSKLDNRITVISNDYNMGLTKSLHRGVACAKGKYIARIDEGDLWYPEKLALQVEFLEKKPDYVLVGSQYLNLCGTTHEITPGTKLPEDFEDVWEWLVGGKTPFTHPAILFRAHLLNYNSDATTSQDFELYLRLGCLGKMANLNLALVEVLRPFDAISNRQQEIQFFNHLIMHKQFIDAIKTGRQKSFAERGVDFGKKPFLFGFRLWYMHFVLKFFGHKKGCVAKKVIKVLFLPDFLFYHLYKRYVFFRFKKLEGLNDRA